MLELNYETKLNREGYRNSFNQFLANVPILYTLKTPENQMFFQYFWGGRGEAGGDGMLEHNFSY